MRVGLLTLVVLHRACVCVCMCPHHADLVTLLGHSVCTSRPKRYLDDGKWLLPCRRRSCGLLYIALTVVCVAFVAAGFGSADCHCSTQGDWLELGWLWRVHGWRRHLDMPLLYAFLGLLQNHQQLRKCL